MSRSMSTPSSTTRNTTTTSSSDYNMSPTPQTSQQTSAGSQRKKAKSDVAQQIDHVQDEIESLHSDARSRHDHKQERFLAKLDAKTEHHRDTRKYEYLRSAREHEASLATTNHQREQEKKDAEIRLRETDIRVHEAHSLVLDKEAENLRLKIQFHQMTQGNRSDGGA
jgi:adenine-specific DNA methylase